jgi:hypothetical protein
MALQYQLDSLDGLDESASKLYVEKDGKYLLDVTGLEAVTPKDSESKAQLIHETEKRKASEAALKEITDELIADVPEEKRGLIPELPPAAKIKWLRNAFKLGLLQSKPAAPIDSKRPGEQKPSNFDNMTPQAIMAQGYKTTS